MKWFNPPILTDQPTQIPELGENLKSIPELIEHLKLLPDTLSKYDPVSLADKLNPIPELIEVLEPIAKVCHYITHPILIWKFIVGFSFWGAAILGTILIIMYVVGYQKGLNGSAMCLLAYTLIKCMDVVIS